MTPSSSPHSRTAPYRKCEVPHQTPGNAHDQELTWELVLRNDSGKYMRLELEGMMDDIRWAFYRVKWSLYRDDSGVWMAFSSTAESHETTDKTNMELWLTNRGLRTEEIERLIRDAENKGEAAITVSQLREPPG